VHFAEDARGVFVHARAGFGQHFAAAGFLEQRETDRVFELTDLHRDRRLGQRQVFGDCGKARLARGLAENLELPQRDAS
jgi:hypothetical protein